MRAGVAVEHPRAAAGGDAGGVRRIGEQVAEVALHLGPVARDGAEMERHLRDLLADPAYAAGIAASGRARVLDRHTCAHRARELLGMLAELGVDTAAEAPPKVAT